MENTGSLCSNIYLPEREKIFRNMEYDRVTKIIYTSSCDSKPIGKVKMGKIFWFKKR